MAFPEIWLIPIFPLIGVFINAFIGHKLPKIVSGAVACIAVLCSFIVSIMGLMALLKLPVTERQVTQKLFTWIATGDVSTSVSFLFDPLSAVMACVVTGIGFLIHVYSTGYMSHDPRYHRFFTYLNLFTFSMLMLVLADNFLLMFVGWEGVGLCSYLLIGFWFNKKSAADAGKKAFIVNRVGDFGFMLGMLLIFATFGSLNYLTVFEQVREVAANPAMLAAIGGAITLICLLLFVGATGKSAQIPLYVWLPDAMEGPTPVSALIHAATMVTAGVYMVSRCHLLFSLAPDAMLVVAVIGALTAIFAATIGLVQNDIKRVLAYSTVSQLGYMFLACGVGNFAAGVFHLMTHAFFKALLFLGSGSVIHGMHEEQDIRKMGGLMKWMPITGITFWIGTLAIAGIPIFSGFFSKDEIVWMSLAGPLGHPVFYIVAVVTAIMTAFYMARLTFKTFHGTPRMSEDVKRHIHESPTSMTVVLVLLALGAAVSGFLNVPKVLGGAHAFATFLEPSVGSYSQVAAAVNGHPEVLAHSGEAHGMETASHGADDSHGEVHHAGYSRSGVTFGKHVDHSLEMPLMILAVALAAGSILFGAMMYLKKPGTMGGVARSMPGLYNTLANKYYVDEFYKATVIRPGTKLSEFLWKGVDKWVIDGLVNATAFFVGIVSKAMTYFQTGYVRNYAYAMLVGTIALIYVLTRL